MGAFGCESAATAADKAGVEGWVRLMGSQLLDAVGESERGDAVKECVEVLQEVCKNAAGGEMISYVRLRALAKKAERS